MMITSLRRIHTARLTDRQLIERLKADSGGRPVDYGQFVKARNLKPGISAKEFHRIFAEVSPNPHVEIVEHNFSATHRDSVTGMLFAFTPDESGLFSRFVAENGMTGSHPTPDGTLPERFEPLEP